MKRILRKSQTLLLSLLSAFAGAVLSQAFEVKIWPYMQMGYDVLTDNRPDPVLSFVVWEQVTNDGAPLDYVNKCVDFRDFLVNSKLAFRLPSSMYVAQTVEQPPNESYCAIVAPFPNFTHPQMTTPFYYPNTSPADAKEDCKDCKLLLMMIANDGKGDVDFLRGKLTLNKNWTIQSLQGSIVEHRDSNTLSIFRESIVGSDVMNGVALIRNATGAKIDPTEFIKRLTVTYGWRSVERSLDRDRINVYYALALTKCRANCKSPDVGNFTAKEWDGM